MTTPATISANTPRDARLIALILASMGVESASEGVIRMLMELAHRYTSDILSDALVFSEHAGKQHATQGPDVEDIRLAVQAKTEHSMAGPMTKEFLLHLADTINRTALPPLPERYGIRLPPEKDRLTAASFDIIPNACTTTSSATLQDKSERQRLGRDLDQVDDGMDGGIVQGGGGDVGGGVGIGDEESEGDASDSDSESGDSDGMMMEVIPQVNGDHQNNNASEHDLKPNANSTSVTGPTNSRRLEDLEDDDYD